VPLPLVNVTLLLPLSEPMLGISPMGPAEDATEDAAPPVVFTTTPGCEMALVVAIN